MKLVSIGAFIAAKHDASGRLRVDTDPIADCDSNVWKVATSER